MRRTFWLPLSLGLLLVLASGLSGCVRPKPSPTPLPTKLGLGVTTTPGAGTPTATRTAVATRTPTLEATPEATETAAPEATALPTTGEVTYVVRWGDTLSSIARQYGTTVDAILANNPRITSPSQIYAGTVLIIRSGSTPPTDTTPGTATEYVVQRGDTLSSIARRFGTTVEALQQANPSITNTSYIQAGLRLVIPGGGGTSSGAARTHVVQQGDTLSSLARLYNTTAWAIMVRNNLSDANVIYPGQVLIMP